MRRRIVGAIAGGLLAGALVLSGAVAWAQPSPATPPATCPLGVPGPMMGPGGQAAMLDAVAHRFIEEMIPHHQDAIAMADLALAQAEHQEIKDLAQAIKTTQAREIEQSINSGTGRLPQRPTAAGWAAPACWTVG